MQTGQYTFYPSLEYYFQDLWDRGRRDYQDLEQDELTCLSGLILRDACKDRKEEIIVESKYYHAFISSLANHLISFDMNVNPETMSYKESFEDNLAVVSVDLSTIISTSAKHEIDKLFKDAALEKAREI